MSSSYYFSLRKGTDPVPETAFDSLYHSKNTGGWIKPMKLTILYVIQHRQTVSRLILAQQNVKQQTQRSAEHSLLSCRHEKP